jgi:hypothetical protein
LTKKLLILGNNINTTLYPTTLQRCCFCIVYLFFFFPRSQRFDSFSAFRPLLSFYDKISIPIVAALTINTHETDDSAGGSAARRATSATTLISLFGLCKRLRSRKE